jgi:hypothetical protein
MFMYKFGHIFEPKWQCSLYKTSLFFCTEGFWVFLSRRNIVRRGEDKSLAFCIFLFAAQPKVLFLDVLKKLEQRSHKCVESRGGICRVNTFFFSIL